MRDEHPAVDVLAAAVVAYSALVTSYYSPEMEMVDHVPPFEDAYYQDDGVMP